MKPDLIAKILELCDYAGASHGVSARTLAAEIRAALEPTQEEAPCPWVWDGCDLRVNDDLFGSVGTDPATGAWTVRVCLGDARVVDDEATARAVLVAMSGHDPGAIFTLSLRPSWTREGLDAALLADLGSVIAPMLEGYAQDIDDPQCSNDPEIAREWWAGGYRCLDITITEDGDDNPF